MHVPPEPRIPSLSVAAQTVTGASGTHTFAAATDPSVFLAAYRGHGLVPGLREIKAPADQAVGSVRQVHVADGSVLTETVTAWEPGRRHAYTLTGFAAPLRWLLRGACAEWTFDADPGGGCRIQWRYDFQPRSQLAAALLRRLLLPSMQRAMQTCLDRLRDQLPPSES